MKLQKTNSPGKGHEVATAAATAEPSQWPPDSVDAAELYVAAEPLAYCEKTKKFFTRDKNSVYWQPISENKLMRAVSMCLRVEAANHTHPRLHKLKNEAYLKAVVRNLKITAGYWNPVEQDGLIPVKNGIVDLTGNEPVFRPHDPTVQSLAGLDLEYSPEAAYPDFLAFLKSGLAEADIELLQRYCGGLLLGRNRYQVILLLLGTSGAGKGTLVELMSRLVGRVNTAELRANKLEERFEISSFAGKKLLIGPEVPRDIFSDRGCGQLKALVGGDLMNPEVKRKQERAGVKGDFHVILHTNSIQQQSWNADLAAFQRRLMVVNYDKPAPTTSIPDLAAALWAEESSGILNWAVEGAVKLKQDGFVLTPEQKQRIELIVSHQPVPTLDSSPPPTLSRFQQFVAAVRAWWNRVKQF
jgi:P4 family phage/plasmid primase-like protien